MQRQLDMSLAGSLEHLPGVAQQFNGPAASQPVIRGLSGDRVLVLEDGQRTGDLSTTAPDHAVSIDPIGAQRIEVVRGPAGLIYGSNALGGVINVIREDVPRSMPDAP
jgi:iron complex outermembrane recepter protein